MIASAPSLSAASITSESSPLLPIAVARLDAGVDAVDAVEVETRDGMTRVTVPPNETRRAVLLSDGGAEPPCVRELCTDPGVARTPAPAILPRDSGQGRDSCSEAEYAITAALDGSKTDGVGAADADAAAAASRAETRRWDADKDTALLPPPPRRPVPLPLAAYPSNQSTCGRIGDRAAATCASKARDADTKPPPSPASNADAMAPPATERDVASTRDRRDAVPGATAGEPVAA